MAVFQVVAFTVGFMHLFKTKSDHVKMSFMIVSLVNILPSGKLLHHLFPELIIT